MAKETATQALDRERKLRERAQKLESGLAALDANPMVREAMKRRFAVVLETAPIILLHQVIQVLEAHAEPPAKRRKR